ncbi:hypothetical protein C2G38_2189298 [Gigaspora rosea]|uniref:Uncharacterized protein n=1 Tax=Gigaspora rosea TaxID=44941 RepID=A0A397VBL0_9GLOM|nr:hypothetical protein C2G38_2189298 [Gigaspora rosea]
MVLRRQNPKKPTTKQHQQANTSNDDNILKHDDPAEFSEGRTIHAALILISYDIPAARKLYGHILALVSCHRCEKSANYINRHFIFGDMQNMDEWFVQKDLAVHQEKALE